METWLGRCLEPRPGRDDELVPVEGMLGGTVDKLVVRRELLTDACGDALVADELLLTERRAGGL